MLISEPHLACILNFALDRQGYEYLGYEIQNKTVSTSQCSTERSHAKIRDTSRWT